MDSPSTAAAIRSPRVSFTSFAAEVGRIERISRNFLRVTLVGEDLAHFHAAGLDQRVKLIFPHAVTGHASFSRDGDDWYSGWRRQPADERCAMRTYTVRAFRRAERELDVDFVVHGDTGPATRWVRRAREGDALLLVGPDARTLPSASEPDPGAGSGPAVGAPVGGVEFCPGMASVLLLAGDETAAPAICSIVESLPATATGQAFIEVASEADVVPVAAPSGLTVTWLAREARGARAARPHGDALSVAVRAWTTEMTPTDSTGQADSDRSGGDGAGLDRAADAVWEVPSECERQGGLYAWVAGEAGCVTGIRRFLVQEAGLDRRDVAFMGYWRAGRSEN